MEDKNIEPFAFTKKTWSTDDTVLPDDLNRYEKGLYDLDNKLTTLNSDRGYLNSKNITDANEAVQNGIYKIKYDSLNLPEASSGVIEVSIYDSSIVFQKLTNANKNTWIRIRKSSEWQSWQQLANTDQINDKLDKLINKSNSSLNQNLSVGTYWFFNPTDGFPSGYTTDSDFILCVYPSSRDNANYQKQILMDIRSNNIFTRFVSAGVRNDWKQLATTQKTEISLLNGWQNTDATMSPFSVIKVGNAVTICGVIKAGTVTHTTSIATLSSEYRPSKFIAFSTPKYRNNTMASFGINTNGSIVIYNRSGEQSTLTGEDISISFTYYV